MVFRRVISTIALCLAVPGSTSADDTRVRARTEVAGYADGDNVRVLSPALTGAIESPSRGLAVSGTYLADIVSAASADIVSSASRGFRETRHVGSVDGRYKRGNNELRLAGGGSFEPDYRGLSSALTVSRDFLHHAHTLAFTYGYGHDIAGRTGTPFDVFGLHLNKHTFGLSATFTLDRRSVVAIAADASIERGDPSKPYRYVPLFAPEDAARVPAGASPTLVANLRAPERMLERLPLSRDRYALGIRYARRFNGTTIRGSERAYVDSWGLLASTTDVRVVFDVGETFSLWPRVRLHMQKGASFYRRTYVIDGSNFPDIVAGDRELGPLVTTTLGVGAQAAFGPHRIALQLDAMVTEFFDALYLRRRSGVFSAFTWETTW